MENLIKLGFINKLDSNLSESFRTQNGLIQVLLGPRQVGKTTSILAYLESKYHGKFHYVSADAVFNSNSAWLLEQWQKALVANQLLVIDEIQKCENWAEVVKKLWDQNRRDKKQLQCVLLGSSSLQIQKGLSESLTGRFQLIQAYHWNFAESKLGYGLDFEQYLKFGGYPGSYPLLKKSNWISYVRQSIISTVIEKDILQYQNVKSPALFKQAFDILISYPAQEISYTKLLGQIQEKGNTDLVKYYLSLYEGAYLIKALEKYSEKKIKIKSSSPKILPLAPCLFYLTVLDQYSAIEKGRVFELIVGAQLVRTRQELFYWRDGQHEVDYVLRQGRKLFGIEVKSGRKKKSGGLLQFKERFLQAKTILIDPENYQEFETDPMAFLEANSF